MAAGMVVDGRPVVRVLDVLRVEGIKMTDSLKKTYSLESGPQHTPVDDYISRCNRQYSELLVDECF